MDRFIYMMSHIAIIVVHSTKAYTSHRVKDQKLEM